MRTVQCCAYGNTFHVDVVENELGHPILFRAGDIEDSSSFGVANRAFLWGLEEFNKNASGEWRTLSADCIEWVEHPPGYWD